MRQIILEGFWIYAERFATSARRIAKCRNETLLIYFATDDTLTLRPIGTHDIFQMI